MNRDQHVISLSTDGKLAQSGEAVSSRAQLAGILEAYAASGKPSMTLVFHGGMVDETEGLMIADSLYPHLMQSAETYPVFVVWRSGALELLAASLGEIVRDSSIFWPVLQKLLKHLEKKYPALGALIPDALQEADFAGALPVGEITDEEADALQRELAADPVAVAALESIVSNARSVTPNGAFEAEFAPLLAPRAETGYLSADLLREVQAQQAPAGVEADFGLGVAAWAFAGRILKAVGARYLAGSDHGMPATVLEEIYRAMYADKIGRFLWDAMKANADGAYGENPAAGGDEADLHGMTLFLQMLREHGLRNGAIPLNLVGHSAGGIHICHLVNHMLQTWGGDFALGKVILTAPACTTSLFAAQVAPALDRIGSLRIFNMQDELERADVLVRFAYPHSLLYLVSGLLEEKPATPLLGLARHVRGKATKAKDVLAVRKLIDEGTITLVLSKSAADAVAGEQAGFVNHYGELGPMHDAATLASIVALLRPEPERNLQPLESIITQEMLPLLLPSADVMRAALTNSPDAGGVHSTDDLLAWQLGGGPAASAPPDEARPAGDELLQLEMDDLFEAIIGENDLVDHRLVNGLVQAGKAVARIVVSGIADFSAVPPDERTAAWQAAVDANTLIRSYGTGWIFGASKRLVMTNNHVIPLVEAARTARAEFGYENSARGVARPQRTLALDPDAFFLTSPNLAFGGLDYTLVALNAEEQTLHAADLATLEPVQGITAATAKSIYIVQHPKGDPKAYVLNHNRKVNLSDHYLTYISDTLRGSSGSPLFNDDLRLVGIHHVGNYQVTIGTRVEQTNLGSRIEVILADIVAQLRTRNFTDDQVLHWFGMGALYSLWRRGQS